MSKAGRKEIHAFLTKDRKVSFQSIFNTHKFVIIADLAL